MNLRRILTATLILLLLFDGSFDGSSDFMTNLKDYWLVFLILIVYSFLSPLKSFNIEAMYRPTNRTLSQSARLVYGVIGTLLVLIGLATFLLSLFSKAPFLHDVVLYGSFMIGETFLFVGLKKTPQTNSDANANAQNNNLQ